jgi:hypothetical protein
LPLLGFRLCPPRAAWCRESVPRLCPGSASHAGSDSTLRMWTSTPDRRRMTSLVVSPGIQ